MKAVTVIVPVYNGEAFLRETIDSVLGQTFPDFELLVLDDGSTDSSPAIIRAYTDERIRYIRCRHDFIATLNKGLALAGGKYIAFLGHDDIMQPGRLAIQYEFMEANPGIAACGGYMGVFGAQSKTYYIPLTHLEMLRSMLLYCPVQNSTGIVRRSVLTLNKIRYKRGYSDAPDYKLWTDIGKVGKLANIPQILTLYRTDEKQTRVKYFNSHRTGGLKVKLEMLEYLLGLLKEGDELTDTICNDVIPILIEAGKLGRLYDKNFFMFMYEMIGGLLKNGVIEIA